MKKILLFVMVFVFMCSLSFAESEAISGSEILEKIKDIEFMYYETISTTSSSMLLPGGNSITEEKVWFKNGHYRKDIYTESANAKKRINILTAEGSYFYNSFSEETKKLKGAPPENIRKSLFNFLYLKIDGQRPFEILGTEEIDGQMTTLIEIVSDFKNTKTAGSDVDIDEIRTKIWLWNARGVPLKEEMKWQEAEYPIEFTTVTEYKNYRFDEIPNETFDILKVD